MVSMYICLKPVGIWMIVQGILFLFLLLLHHIPPDPSIAKSYDCSIFHRSWKKEFSDFTKYRWWKTTVQGFEKWNRYHTERCVTTIKFSTGFILVLFLSTPVAHIQHWFRRCLSCAQGNDSAVITDIYQWKWHNFSIEHKHSISCSGGRHTAASQNLKQRCIWYLLL